MRAVLALLALVAWALPARALDDPAREAARAAITRQVEALGRDDAESAFALAAPSIQALFPTPDVFIGMVRSNYTPIYRHRSFVFGEARETAENGLSQDVAIQDAYGVDWSAAYSLERQADGSWRITGCRLSKSPGTSL
ncbi:DUF4864 domain-containing protein [Methylobacterium planeticum]|uniref:DUF4864 domain-containing protein n=1 Tax=Methylobacterium planeticum TaxID=2615211 RepID=A0A6N6MNN6_9HYPH|nr:DUF4864 domain-containing protein [Methylobacterium planeticum]KAB1073069.1 DUF4864 domain-containing protein [Methylobacterium planeticum]